MIPEPAAEVITVQVDDRGRLGALHPEVARHARRLGADDELAWRVALATHEVCTNVFVHGAGGAATNLAVAVTRTSSGLRVTVADTTPPFAPDASRPTCGLGLTLVHGLADRVVYEVCDGGNTTTLEFHARSPLRAVSPR